MGPVRGARWTVRLRRVGWGGGDSLVSPLSHKGRYDSYRPQVSQGPETATPRRPRFLRRIKSKMGQISGILDWQGKGDGRLRRIDGGLVAYQDDPIVPNHLIQKYSLRHAQHIVGAFGGFVTISTSSAIPQRSDLPPRPQPSPTNNYSGRVSSPGT